MDKQTWGSSVVLRACGQDGPPGVMLAHGPPRARVSLPDPGLWAAKGTANRGTAPRRDATEKMLQKKQDNGALAGAKPRLTVERPIRASTGHCPPPIGRPGSLRAPAWLHDDVAFAHSMLHEDTGMPLPTCPQALVLLGRLDGSPVGARRGRLLQLKQATPVLPYPPSNIRALIRGPPAVLLGGPPANVGRGPVARGVPWMGREQEGCLDLASCIRRHAEKRAAQWSLRQIASPSTASPTGLGGLASALARPGTSQALFRTEQ